MSKIAIISQPDQGVLIDVSGCTSIKEALEHLSSTLQVSSQFWKGMKVSLNLGSMNLTDNDVAQILALAKGVGIHPSGVYTTSDETKASLKSHNISLGVGKPMTLPKVSLDGKVDVAEQEGQKANSALATIKMRVVDAISSRKAPKDNADDTGSVLEDMAPIEDDEDDIAEKPAAEKKTSVKVKRRVSLDGKQVGSPETKDDGTITLDGLEPIVVPKSPAGSLDTGTVTGTPSPTATAGGSNLNATTGGSTPVVTAGGSEPSATTGGTTVAESTASISAASATEATVQAPPAATAVAAETAPKAEVQATAVVEPVEESEEVASEGEDDLIENAEEYDEEIEADSIGDELNVTIDGPTTLYLCQNLRSGQTVSHKGHLVIIGDINPGAEVMAEGDITVWGSLRGVAHAGIGGNVNAEIRALKLQPIQIRIAHAIARAPDRPRVSYAQNNGPETARMVGGKIRVSKSRLE